MTVDDLASVLPGSIINLVPIEATNVTAVVAPQILTIPVAEVTTAPREQVIYGVPRSHAPDRSASADPQRV